MSATTMDRPTAVTDARPQAGTLTPDICVIGAGSAGLTVAAAAAGFGVDVVLIERGPMGGDCLNYGCVPSKSLIAAARHVAQLREAAAFGVLAGPPEIDFGRVHAHVREVIAAIAPHDSQERFEGLGVTVLRESARFIGPDTVEAGGRRVRARRFVIATGSHPVVPDIEGIDTVPVLTNESVFDLTALPERLAILGGGPIGIELAQAFRRLGSAVTVIERDRILSREDAVLVEPLRSRLAGEGVVLREGTVVRKVTRTATGVALALGTAPAADSGAEGTDTLDATHLLVAAGRRPQVADLGLDAAGVEAGPSGIVVDAGLRTSNRRIYAIGDVTGGLQFTHVAGHQASLAVRSILFRMPVRMDPGLMPRVTFTDPEIAVVGLTEGEARQRFGERVSVAEAAMGTNDRARAERRPEGLVRLVTGPGGRLLGAGATSAEAGEIIAPLALAIQAKVPLSKLASATFPYPTRAEIWKTAAIAHYKPKLTSPWIRRMVRALRLLG